jgi:antitoxin MazE
MRTELIRIGNSRGIRIPKPVIDHCGFEGTVELSVENERLIVSPGRKLRQGWSEAFEKAGTAKNDALLLEPMQSGEFDRTEWKW